MTDLILPGGQNRIYQKADGSWVTEQAPLPGVTWRMNAGSVASGQSLKVYSGTIALSTTVTTTVALETVASGKQFYVTDIIIGSNSAAPFLVQITAAGTPVFSQYCKGDTGPIQATGIESQPSATSTQAVNLVFGIVGSATTASYNVSGFEQ